ncbi:hypothetical protein [Xanthomonas hortorum]|uniref:hypothetical protein n=1 Tax=Xanthomonas hortorum TaxID=56454 RepID=UPI002006FAF1|nr:hypothetical protein [Xanthomonas hortorum]
MSNINRRPLVLAGIELRGVDSHITPQMTHRYDHELQVIAPPTLPTDESSAEALAFVDLVKPSES